MRARANLALELPSFELERYVSTYAAESKYHLSASDAETISIKELLQLDGHVATENLLDLRLGYSDPLGSWALRQAISDTYTTQEANSIVAFAGAGEAIFAVFNTLLEPGDHAIAISPNYQSHESLPSVLCDVTRIDLCATKGWKLDIDAIADAAKPNTRAIIINYPHNPTGTVLSPQELRELVEISRQNGSYLINDEVFHGLGPSSSMGCPAVADLYERGVSINVLSKSYGLPGLRIGWVATRDQDLLNRLIKFKNYLSVCTSTVGEFLAEIALKQRASLIVRNNEIVDHNIGLWRSFFSRHDVLFKEAYPQGGCIAYPEYLGSSPIEDFADALRSQYGVFIVPSSIFAPNTVSTPTKHFRIGFGRRGLSEGLQAFDEALTEGGVGR